MLNHPVFSFQKINPRVMLVLSRMLAAARPAIIAILIAQGFSWSDGRAHPISFCNILFIGNFCAALVVGLWFGFSNIFRELKSLEPKTYLGLFLNGSLATLLSTLIFLGLKETSVTNAVLLGRLGPVLVALIGALLFRKKVKPAEWFGFSLIAVGVIAIAFRTSGYQTNPGDILILLSTLIFASSTLVNKYMVGHGASIATVVFSRNLISSTIFLGIALHYFGPDHFGDAFSGQLWILMLVYSIIVIVMAQLLWYASTVRLDPRTIGRFTVMSPIFGVTYAYLLNGEHPSSIQWITLGLVVAGVLITSLGKEQPSSSKDMIAQEPESSASMP